MLISLSGYHPDRVYLLLLSFLPMNVQDNTLTHAHTAMPCCGPRGPLCLVWRVLTLGLWPLLEATPFSALLHLLFEDHTLFILLASFLSSAPLFCWRLELSMDLMHSQLREPQQLQVFTFDLRHFQASLTMCFHLSISTTSRDDGLRADFFLVAVVPIYMKWNILSIEVIHF